MKNIINISNVGLIVLILASHSTFGQDSLSLRKFEYAFSVYVGPQGIDSRQLNDELALNGIDRLRKTATVFGTIHTVFFGKFGLGSSFDFLNISSSSGLPRYSVMTGYTYGTHVAYYIVERPNFALYPLLEARTAYLSVKTIQRSTSSDINDILVQSQGNTTVRYKSDMISIGLGLSSRRAIRNFAWNCPQADRFISFDLIVGYNFTLDANHGQYYGVNISNGPTLKYNGPYLKAGIGFGSRMRRMRWR